MLRVNLDAAAVPNGWVIQPMDKSCLNTIVCSRPTIGDLIMEFLEELC